MIITIEGIDGSGKTTQAKELVQRLRRMGYRVKYIQPVFIFSKILNIMAISPRKTRASELKGLKGKRKPFFIRKFIMGLFGYPYAMASYILIKFYLIFNKIIVCDRWFYQFLFDAYGDQSEDIIKIFPKSDITFFLDGSLDLFYSRMSNKYDVSVSREYYAHVLNLYRKLSKRYGFIQIDAGLDRDKINDILFNNILNLAEGFDV